MKDSPIWKDFVDNFDEVAPLAFGLFGNMSADAAADLKKIKAFYNIDPKKFQGWTWVSRRQRAF